MQATVRTNNGFGFDRIKTALVAAGLLVTTIAGTAALQLLHDTDSVAPARIAASVHNDKTTWRFAEINALPEASVQPVDWATIHFAEINALPEAAVAPLTDVQIRFLEMNQLPGDELVAPEVIPGAPS
jgi:hypothetical protein